MEYTPWPRCSHISHKWYADPMFTFETRGWRIELNVLIEPLIELNKFAKWLKNRFAIEKSRIFGSMLLLISIKWLRTQPCNEIYVTLYTVKYIQYAFRFQWTQPIFYGCQRLYKRNYSFNIFCVRNKFLSKG